MFCSSETIQNRHARRACQDGERRSEREYTGDRKLESGYRRSGERKAVCSIGRSVRQTVYTEGGKGGGVNRRKKRR
jgi:hypothetical protein